MLAAVVVVRKLVQQGLAVLVVVVMVVWLPLAQPAQLIWVVAVVVVVEQTLAAQAVQALSSFLTLCLEVKLFNSCLPQHGKHLLELLLLTTLWWLGVVRVV